MKHLTSRELYNSLNNSNTGTVFVASKEEVLKYNKSMDVLVVPLEDIIEMLKGFCLVWFDGEFTNAMVTDSVIEVVNND